MICFVGDHDNASDAHRYHDVGFADDSDIVRSDRFSIVHGLVSIQYATAEDKGLYKCKASNNIGTIEKSIVVTLTGD